MIEIRLQRENTGNKARYYARAIGHGDYAEYGKDIVCAAVSALFTAAIQQLLYYYGANEIECIKFDLKRGEGWINAEIEEDEAAARKAEGIFDMLFTGLEMISEQHPKNVEIVRL